MKNHIAIVGAGNGGQAFAGYLSLMGERIKIFDVIPATVEKLNEVGGVLMTILTWAKIKFQRKILVKLKKQQQVCRK